MWRTVFRTQELTIEIPVYYIVRTEAVVYDPHRRALGLHSDRVPAHSPRQAIRRLEQWLRSRHMWDHAHYESVVTGTIDPRD